MPLFYRTGEDIRVGDRVVYDGVECEVEFMADPEADPADWYVTEYGACLLLTDEKVFGRVLVKLPAKRLDFRGRAPGQGSGSQAIDEQR